MLAGVGRSAAQGTRLVFLAAVSKVIAAPSGSAVAACMAGARAKRPTRAVPGPIVAR